MGARRFATLIALCAISVFLISADNNCDPDFPAPPFDATGDYQGIWHSEFNPAECKLYATLDQDVDGDYPNDHVVTGTLAVDLTCIEAWGWWTPPIDPVEMDIYGTMADGGDLVMAGVGYGTVYGIEVNLSGPGTDFGPNGQMDKWDGDISVRILDLSNNPYIARHGDFELHIQ